MTHERLESSHGLGFAQFGYLSPFLTASKIRTARSPVGASREVRFRRAVPNAAAQSCPRRWPPPNPIAHSGLPLERIRDLRLPSLVPCYKEREGGLGMTIYRLLQNSPLGPDEIAVLTDAYEDTAQAQLG